MCIMQKWTIQLRFCFFLNYCLSFRANLQRVPVDQVVFLRSRVRARQKGCAQLISSEAGVARFWDIFSAKKEPLGKFDMCMYM